MMDTNTLLDAVAEIVREQVADLRRDAEAKIAAAQTAADAANTRADKLAQDLEAAAALALEQRPAGVTEDDVTRAVDAAVRAALSSRLEDVERRLAGMHGAADRFDEKLAALESRPQGMAQEAVQRLVESAAGEAEVRAGEAAELAVDAIDARLKALEDKVGAVTEVSESRALEFNLEVDRLSKALDGALSDIEQVRDNMVGAASVESVQQSFDALKDVVSRAENEVAKRLREIADAQDQIKLTNDEVVTKAIAQMRSSAHGAEAWKRGGAGYQKFSVVRHRGALWQTPVETGEEPGRGDDWALLADGVRDVRTSVSDDGVFTLAIDTASGQTSEAQFQLPKVNFVGVYDKAATYKKWDAMIRDGHTFLALKDDPGEVGIDNGGWMTIGYRGKAGKRGPTLDETCDELRPGVVRALMGEMPEMVSTAVQALTEGS